MSEEDAALFWEIDDQSAPGTEDGGVGPGQADRTVPVME